LASWRYGRIEVRAKLPTGYGTWPAIWMLGANFSTVGWPACGEIDIMEGIGNNPGFIQSAIHTPSSFGDTQNKGNTTIADASSEFHVYSVNWSENQISFLVDDEIYYTYKPDVKDGDTWPFDANQFLILNVAMGGTLGGTIDPAFTESSMEVDYVRVYQ
jgi:beta-glucanase (GH16 family)